jgi:signal transduction histidine kinase/CheY-like chemotaxis protein
VSQAELSNKRLLSFARKLQRAHGFGELIQIARDETRRALGYETVWMMVGDEEFPGELRLLEYSGERPDDAWQHAVRLKVKGDAFLEEIIASEQPLVIEDARVDPRTNKQIVEQLQNRTIVNVPLRMLDEPFGIFGTGTFGDEGCRAPTEAELEYLVGMVSQLAVAAGRIRFVEARVRAEREKLALERQLAQIQRHESLGMLAGGVAHDFNNLLTVILASAALAEARVSGDDELLEDIEAIVSAANRARELTRQLLAMSRTQRLDLRPIDLNAHVVRFLGLMRRVLPESIAIELTRADVPIVHGDEAQLDQVFMNLCINARDAMPEGGRLKIDTADVTIDAAFVEAHPEAKPGRYARVTVADTGVGMPKEIVDRVFEPFFTTKSEHIGTGLGLAVAYGIVRQHDGLLHCESTPGAGTTFAVYLPVVERSGTVERATRDPSAAPLAGHETILVAEDEPAVRAIAVRILERAGYRVTAVADGEAAWEIAQRDPPDLVLLDVVMPGPTCETTVERLRGLRSTQRILLTSGYSAGSNITSLKARRLTGFLPKPYDPSQLLRAVRVALDEDDV